MPNIVDLGSRSERLRGVSLIVGEGLCSNIYVIGKERAVIVDTGVGNYMNPVWPQLKELGIETVNVEGVVLSHAHHDHSSGVLIILQYTEPKTYVHLLETRFIASHLGSNLVTVEDGDIIQTELWPLKVLWTPGHTEGGICLYAEDEHILFSGDTVFPGGYFGRYDGEMGSLEAIVASLMRLSELNIETILPGHGMPVYQDAGEHIRLAYMRAASLA
jgi:glyoxylase-like metal-dependent hydrolase (beta-lactamase superfamily II)